MQIPLHNPATFALRPPFPPVAPWAAAGGGGRGGDIIPCPWKLDFLCVPFPSLLLCCPASCSTPYPGASHTCSPVPLIILHGAEPACDSVGERKGLLQTPDASRDFTPWVSCQIWPRALCNLHCHRAWCNPHRARNSPSRFR